LVDATAQGVSVSGTLRLENRLDAIGHVRNELGQQITKIRIRRELRVDANVRPRMDKSFIGHWVHPITNTAETVLPSKPIAEQIVGTIAKNIRKYYLRFGERKPTTRKLREFTDRCAA
jgi:hypothetical protein